MLLQFKSGVQISAGFWLLAAWFAVVNGWRILLMVLGAAFIHEVGHYLVLRLLGAKILSFRMGVLGMVLETDRQRLSYPGELVSVLAGPAANLLCAWMLALAGRSLDAAIGAHLVLGGFNLLPIRPLDGGQALYLVSAWLLGPSVGEQIARWAGAVTGASLVGGICWLMWYTGGSLWLLPAAAGMVVAAGRECFGKGAFV